MCSTHRSLFSLATPWLATVVLLLFYCHRLCGTGQPAAVLNGTLKCPLKAQLSSLKTTCGYAYRLRPYQERHSHLQLITLSFEPFTSTVDCTLKHDALLEASLTWESTVNRSMAPFSVSPLSRPYSVHFTFKRIEPYSVCRVFVPQGSLNK